VDADCTSAQFCDTEQNLCVPKLTNGSSVPTILLHDPALSGTCSTRVGTSVCQSGICDMDNKCGLMDGDGPCTSTNGATVCRTGTCNASGLCGASVTPNTGCKLDTDCTSTQYCNTESHTCSPKLDNGSPVPTVNGHTPELAGTCAVLVAQSVCVSAVCDTSDNSCGFLDGNGTCSKTNAGTVCRSGKCTSSGVCGTDPTGTTPKPDTGTIEGGGIGCQTAHGGGSSRSILMMLGMLGLVWGIRRRSDVALRGRQVKSFNLSTRRHS